MSFRANEEDFAILDDLQKRLGLTRPQVIKLALRRLLQQEKRADKK